MTARTNAAEAVSVLNSLADALMAFSGGQSGNAGAQLLYQVGNLRTNGGASIASGVLGAQLVACYAAATAAGASLTGYAALRGKMAALIPSGAPGKAIAAAGIRFALIQETLILAKTTFVSRDDVDAQMSVYDAAFDGAETYAADAADVDVYRALVTLHASVMNDLTTRSRPLPSLVSYKFSRVYSARSLALRLYGDASRARELIDENGIVNPGFLPLSIQALSA